MKEPFDQDYYQNGPETGKSNYRDYRWLPDLTIPACRKISEYLGMQRGESILDYGCALGFYTKAFRAIGYRAYGYDVSEWAIANCDPQVVQFVGNTVPQRAFDWAFAKDVFEHINQSELAAIVDRLNATISKGMLIIVPLCAETGGGYIREEDEKDSTHVIRWTLEDWITFLERYADGFNVNASYHIHGIKPAANEVRHSCGFFTLIRP